MTFGLEPIPFLQYNGAVKRFYDSISIFKARDVGRNPNDLQKTIPTDNFVPHTRRKPSILELVGTRFVFYLNGRAIVGLDHVTTSLEERVVLDIGGVHQYLVATFIFTVLPGNHSLAVLVHVKEVRVDRHSLDLTHVC